MGALLKTLFMWVLSGMIARTLLGAGVTLVTATWLGGAVDDALRAAVNQLGQGGAPFQLILLAGLGQAMTIIGTAIMTRMSIVAGARVIGVKIGG